MLCVAVHNHEHGTDAYLFDFQGKSLPSREEEVARQLSIDYEPDRGEDLILAVLAGVPTYGIPQARDLDRLPIVR